MFATTDSLSVPFANIVIPPSYTPLLPHAIEGWGGGRWGLLGPLGVQLLFPKTWGVSRDNKHSITVLQSRKIILVMEAYLWESHVLSVVSLLAPFKV